MIDATKSPMPTWKRYGTIVLLGVLILVAGYVLWTKELHHSSAATTTPPPAAHPITSASKSQAKTSTSTTIPGGIPISSRNPFQG